MMAMSQDLLRTYLSDHLAGSVGALEIIGRAAEREAGTELGRFFAGLGREVEADQEVLRDLLVRLGGSESTVKKAAVWLADKASQLKLAVSGEAAALARVEELEALAMGIQGKLGLWTALQAVSGSGADLRFQGIDLARLADRARQQYEAVERRRIEAARAALAG